jgi:hypothetical protein
VAALRVRAHQLQAAARAADHFLDQDAREDRETGGWLVATAMGLAHKLASDMDDCMGAARRAGPEAAVVEPHDPSLIRRVAAASAQARGVA